MTLIKVRGFDIETYKMKGSSTRRCVQIKNNILMSLRKLGVHEDDVEIELEKVPIKRTPASASWYYSDEHLYFSYAHLSYIENLHIVSKIIEIQVNKLLNEEISEEEFLQFFVEDVEIEKKRMEARKTLGIDENSKDINEVNKKYKDLAKVHHPDMGGDMDEFKKINNAHKILRKELE